MEFKKVNGRVEFYLISGKDRVKNYMSEAEAKQLVETATKTVVNGETVFNGKFVFEPKEIKEEPKAEPKAEPKEEKKSKPRRRRAKK